MLPLLDCRQSLWSSRVPTAGTSGMACVPAESICCQMEAMYKVCGTTGLRVTPACGVGQ